MAVYANRAQRSAGASIDDDHGPILARSMMLPASHRARFCLTIVSLTAGAGRQGIDDPDAPRGGRTVLRHAAGRGRRRLSFALERDGQAADRRTAQVRVRCRRRHLLRDRHRRHVPSRRSGPRARVGDARSRHAVAHSRPSAITSHSTTAWSLTYVREGDEWKLVREGSAVDDLADRLIEAPTPEAREALLLAEPELVNDGLIIALSRRAGQAAQEQAYASSAGRLRAHARRRPARRQQEAGGRGAAEPGQRAVLSAQPAGRSPGVRGAPADRARTGRFGGHGGGPARHRDDSLLVRRIRHGPHDVPGSARDPGAPRRRRARWRRRSSARGTCCISRAISRPRSRTTRGAGTSTGSCRTLPAKPMPSKAWAACSSRRGTTARRSMRLSGVLAEGKARNDRNDQGTALLSIGDVHFRLGNLDQCAGGARRKPRAFRGGEASRRMRAARGRRWRSSTSWPAGSRCPRTSIGRAATAARRRATRSASAGAVAGLAFAQTAQEKFAEGIASYKKAIEAFTALKRVEQAARAEIGLSRALTRERRPCRRARRREPRAPEAERLVQ